jgi:hypothetical protein
VENPHAVLLCVFLLNGSSFCGIWVSSFNMAHSKTLKPPKNFKLCCLFGQQSKVVGNAAESSNQGATRALRDKRKSIMNEGSPFQIDVTFEVELEITLDKIECKKRKKLMN